MKTKKEINEILKILKQNYKDYKCGLNFSTPFELLVATILSAQCTDERVNIVTEKLFKDANTPEKIYLLGENGLLKYIKSCGLSNTKSKNIIQTSKILIDKYNSNVPCDMNELMSLPGVGRKTANVVLSNAFNIPAIAVDTHVNRVSNRIGLSESKDVLKTEQELMKLIPKEDWSDAHHQLIWHGRKVCNARKPSCTSCPLRNLCDYYKNNAQSE